VRRCLVRTTYLHTPYTHCCHALTSASAIGFLVLYRLVLWLVHLVLYELIIQTVSNGAVQLNKHTSIHVGVIES